MERGELSAEERRAVNALRRLSKKWPRSLWLFSGSGSLHIMKALPDGSRAHLPSDGVDPAYVIETVDIPNDGGDW
jgi:hypothetical protein